MISLRRSVVSLGLALLAAAPVWAAGMDLVLTPAEGSRLALEVEKTGFLRGKKHVFLFDRYRAELNYDAGHPENSRVSLVIEAPSIRCIDTWISEKDLKKVTREATEVMLQVSRYPELRFTSTAVRAKGGGQFEVDGNLTIRDVTRPVTVSLGLKEGAGGRLSFEGTSKFKMTAFGLKPPSAALGTVGTKDEMTVLFTLFAAAR